MSVERMSSLDATFLHVEDSVSHMHIASVAIFEGPQPPSTTWCLRSPASCHSSPGPDGSSARLPLDLGRPVWVDDPHFNVGYHVRNTALPSPGGEDELRKLVGRVMSRRLDRSKPLWMDLAPELPPPAAVSSDP